MAATNVGAGPLIIEDQAANQDQAESWDQAACQDQVTSQDTSEDDDHLTTTASGELLMPVEDHFKDINGCEVQDSTEDDKPHVIKTLTKKLKFWSWVGRPSDDNSENQANNQVTDSTNEGAAKSVDDEIEAILSTPKKKTKKKSEKAPVPTEDAAVHETSSITATASQSDEVPPLQTDQDKVTNKATSPAANGFSKEPSPPIVKPKPATSTVKKRVATFDRNNDNPAPPSVRQKMTMMDNSSDNSGPPPVRRKTASLHKNTSSTPARRKTDSATDIPVIKHKTATQDKSRDTPPLLDTASANPCPLPVTQKPTVAVKPKPTAKPQAHIAPLQREATTPESILRQLEQKACDNDYYQLLEVDPSADFNEISRRRRERSKELHPDHFMTDATQKAK